MKKVLFFAAFLFLIAAAALADNPKYQIYSESKGVWGLGGRRVIMLDKITGDSWQFIDNKWVPIEKVAATGQLDEDIKTRLTAEIEALKDKQAQEIKTLKIRQAEELVQLRTKKPMAVALQASHKTQPSYAKKKAAKPAAEEDNNSGTEAPPTWLNE